MFKEYLKDKLGEIGESDIITLEREAAYGLLNYINYLEETLSTSKGEIEYLRDTISEIEEDYDARIEELQGEIYDLGGSI